MIVGTVSHGRTRRDTANLVRHLEKTAGQTTRLVAMDNLAARDLREGLQAMEILRDGSRAEVAFHHITISPRHRLTDEQRDEAVARILTALKAEDHPWVLIEHDEKQRASEGGADHHFHLAVGHVGLDLRALNMSGSYARLEAVARSLELDWGEELTQTRRHAAVALQAAEMGRDDVAEAIRTMKPEAAEDLTRAAMSSATRQRAERQGIDLPAAKAFVADAFQRADGPKALRAALAEEGLTLAPGSRAGVWIVMRGEDELGSLDRLTKTKRREVSAWMERQEQDHEQHSREAEGRRIADTSHNEQSRSGGASGTERDQRDPGPAIADGRERGPTQPDLGDVGADIVDLASPAAEPGRDEQAPRPDRAAIAHIETLRADRHPDAQRLVEMAREIAALADPVQHHVDRAYVRLGMIEEEARQRLQNARQRPVEPAGLVDTRQQAEEAHKTARKAVAAEKTAQERVAILEAHRPSGLWAWVSGKTAQHKQEMEAAQQAERNAAGERKRTEQMAVARAEMSRTAERRWAEKREGIEKEKKAEAQEAERTMAWVESARRALRKNPELARDDEALNRAVLEEKRRVTEDLRRSAERARQEIRQQEREAALRPRGPTLGR